MFICYSHLLAEENYTIFVFPNIKGTFDSVKWRDILLQLWNINARATWIEALQNTYDIVLFIFYTSYLQDISAPIKKWCPQGSRLSSILWILIIHMILKELKILFHLLCFRGCFQLCYLGCYHILVSSWRYQVPPLHFASFWFDFIPTCHLENLKL